MTSSDLPALLQATADVARLMGDTAQSYFRTPIAAEIKNDGSPVTIADRQAELSARDWIAQRFPNDGVLGEEFGEHHPAAARQWILDPIDGTKSFVRGVPLWGSLVAVCDGSSVLAGAAYFPPLDEIIVAALGEGAWWNSIRCHVSAVSDIGQATVLTTDERFGDHDERRALWRALSARAGLARGWGDCFGYLMVATGRAEAMVDPVLSPWDAAPFLPIITEAGGVFSDWTGRATIRGGSAIATNHALAVDLRVALDCPVDLLEMERI